MGRQKSEVSLIALDEGAKRRKKRKIRDYGSKTHEVAVLSDVCQSAIVDLKKMLKLPSKGSFLPPGKMYLMGSSQSVHSLPSTQHVQTEPLDADRGARDIGGMTLTSALTCSTSIPLITLDTQQDECNDIDLLAQSIRPTLELKTDYIHDPYEGCANVEVHNVFTYLLDECNDGDLLARSVQQSSQLQSEYVHEPYEGAVTVEVPTIFSSLLEKVTVHGIEFTYNGSELNFESEHERQARFLEQSIIHGPGIEEMCDHQQEKSLEPDETPSNLAVAETIEETGSVSDDDGLERLWQDMAFSIACADGQGAKDNSTKLISKNINECDHSFILKDDVGLVCDLCGLVGRDIETIFQFTWGKAHKRKQGKQQVLESQLSESLEEELNDVEDHNFHKQGHEILTVHPDHMEKMHEHQIDGFHFLERNILGNEPGGCILAHAPGTGKSFLIISFVQSFLQVHPEERIMLIAPKGMLLPWVKEFHKWNVEEISIVNLYDAHSSGKHSGDDATLNNPSAHVQRLRVSQLQIIKDWKMKKKVLLVSYPLFRTLVNGNVKTDQCLETRKLLLETPGILILDEGHVPRNKDSKIVNCLMHVHTKRRILLSGTLFQNNFEELFYSFKLVRPDFMSAKPACVKSLLEPFVRQECKEGLINDKVPRVKSKRQNREALELKIFEESLGERIQFGNKEEQDHAIKMLRQLTESFVHWYKGQVLEKLPGLTDLTVVLNLTKAQEDAMHSIQAHTDNAMDREHKSALACIHPSLYITAEDELNVSGQATDHSVKSDEDPRHGVKIEFVLEMVALCHHLNEKVIVFSQHIAPLFLLERLLKKFQGLVENNQIFRLDGPTLLEERENIIDRFNNERQAQVLLASIRTCGEGISLIGASRIIFLDVAWNPSITRQAISRAFRIGQKKKVYVYRLVAAGTYEEDIHSVASKKEWLAKMIFEANEDKSIELTSHEVDAQGDLLFQSSKIRNLVKKCHKSS